MRSGAEVASCVYEGQVRHRRMEPVEHSFVYSMFMMYVDLAELPELLRGRWLWSAERPALARFKREDHLGDPAVPLEESVRRLVESRLGRRPEGPIRLLTHFRYYGYVFNPVSFYYCYDAAGRSVSAVVAEVNNTPWGERHCYVLDKRTAGPNGRFKFEKSFLVSPFIDLDVGYDWTFTEPGERILVHMENLKEGRTFFDATMTLRRRPLNGATLASCLARYPFMTGKVIAAIYWQAARLWLKGIPFLGYQEWKERRR